jgi:dTDP-4-dehydrorhamnose 3,5-epimerase
MIDFSYMAAFTKLEIPDVVLIEPQLFKDNRGFFMETFKSSDFNKNNIPNFVQENHSYSIKNVLRGLHFQRDPNAQGKLVRCISGEIFDVAIDIRDDSPTKYKWVSAILSKENGKQLYIPPGFAHGFCVLGNEAEVIYKCSMEYAKESEGGILWNDPKINIDWPIKNPILSEKDQIYLPL